MPDAKAMLFIALTIAFTVVGQLLVKLGTSDLAGGAASAPLLALVWRAATNLKIIAGFGCAVLAAIVWMVALARSNLSFAYPFMGLAIVLVLALSPLVLGERVPAVRWAGVAFVCAGLWLAARA